MNKNILISVIMPSYNQGQYIERAIQSFFSQNYENKELIIIDAVSNDGAYEIIKKYSDRITYWESKKDKGQSDAINKGLSKCKGDIVTWLNSDDILMPGALTKVAEAYRRIDDKAQCWIVGGVVWLDSDNRIIQLREARPFFAPLVCRGIQGVFGPSSFISREIIQRFGYLDTNLHYMMDTELWIRLSREGIKYTAVPGYLWGLRLHATAKMSGHNFSTSPMSNKKHPIWLERENEHKVIEERYPNSFMLFWRLIGYLASIFSVKTIMNRIATRLNSGKEVSLINEISQL